METNWRLERAMADREAHATEQRLACREYACRGNGTLDTKSQHDVSTTELLCVWLNKLARKVGIARSDSNPGGYFATPATFGR